MLQQLSANAWQKVTLNCKKLSIDETNPPVFKSDTGDITSVEMLSNSCQVIMVIEVGIMCNVVTDTGGEHEPREGTIYASSESSRTSSSERCQYLPH